MGIPIDQLKGKLPARYHAQIEAARAQKGRGLPIPTPPGKVAEGRPKRVRQSSEVMNKLEKSYYDMLRVQYPNRRVLAQKLRLMLGNGNWYKPDIFIPSLHYVFEVKGPHAYRGGMENLKVAAESHRWLTFFLVWKIKGEWFRQEIKPSNGPS
jgi:hypothetical protein